MSRRWYWFIRTLRHVAIAVALAYVILKRETLFHEEVSVIIMGSLIVILVILFVLYDAYK